MGFNSAFKGLNTPQPPYPLMPIDMVI